MLFPQEADTGIKHTDTPKSAEEKQKEDPPKFTDDETKSQKFPDGDINGDSSPPVVLTAETNYSL